MEDIQTIEPADALGPVAALADQVATGLIGHEHLVERLAIALLAGGAVNGGRVISDWPGLKIASLYEGRDLKPTTDLRGVIKGVLRDHLGLGERVLAETVVPDSGAVKAMQGLVV